MQLEETRFGPGAGNIRANDSGGVSSDYLVSPLRSKGLGICALGRKAVRTNGSDSQALQPSWDSLNLWRPAVDIITLEMRGSLLRSNRHLALALQNNA